MLSPAHTNANASAPRRSAGTNSSNRPGTAATPLLRIVDAQTERELLELNLEPTRSMEDESRLPSSAAGALLELVGPLARLVSNESPEPQRRSDDGQSRNESSLAAYLKQLRGYPLLTREAEHELAVDYAATGSPAAAARLITANLRLVVKIAREHGNAQIHLLDLIQEGNLGLVKAVQKYDPNRGVRLSSYAAWWIRAFILKFTLSNCRLVRIGTTQVQRKLFFNLGHERAKLERSGGRVGAEALAASLGVPEGQVIEMESRLGEETRLDAPMRGPEGDKRLLGDLVPAPDDQRPDTQTESGQFRALLRSKLQGFESSLDHRDREIFQRRLLNDEPVTAVQIAEQFGISRERVRQLEARLLLRLRQLLTDEMGDAVCCA